MVTTINTVLLRWLKLLPELFSLEKRWSISEDSDDEQGFDNGMDNVFFPGSDELGFIEEEIGDERFTVQNWLMLVLPYHSDGGSDDEGGVDSHNSQQ